MTNSLDINESMCIMAWDTVAIRPYGVVLPCCRFKPDAEFAAASRIDSDFRNGQQWQQLRQKMLDGEPLKGCQTCYQDDAAKKTSMRVFETRNQIVHLHKPVPTTTESTKLRFLEIAFSNLCNLACVGCNANFSSTWAAEDYKRGRLNTQTTSALVQHDNDLSDLDLSSLEDLKLIGGEPFMDQKRYIELMSRVDLSRVRLRISTNGTVLPSERLRELMEQCKQVILRVSIDGVRSVNEWYRWPTNFTEFQSNLDQFESWWGNNPRFILATHTVVNIYNVWTLDQLVLFMNDRYPRWSLDFDLLKHPNWQSVLVLPEEHKHRLSEKLAMWHNTISGNWPEWHGCPFETTRQKLQLPAQSTIEEFKEKTLALAAERNLDLFKMVPDIQPLFRNSP
jgi:uncharacterized Fe-S cluster-containing radical SAM superfamily protein